MKRLAAVVLALAGCHAAAPPPAPVGNQATAPAPAAASELPPNPETTAVIAEARAARSDGDRAACISLLATLDESVLGSRSQGEEALALMQDCIARTDADCDFYLEGLDGESPYCALALAVAFGPRAAYDDAVSQPCGFGDVEGYDGELLAIPGDPDHCLGVTMGDGMELSDLTDDGVVPAGVCPSMALVDRRAASRPVTHVGASFIDDPSTCCNLAPPRLRRNGATVEVLLPSGGPARDCFGGTASTDQLEVYRLDGTQLTPVADLGVGMH